MATFSPAPAHRRASLMRTSPRAGGSRKPSRMSLTPFSDAYTEETGMDVDEGSTAPTETAVKAKPSKELLYANSREFKVSYYAGLPLEVKTALQKNNNFEYDSIYSGSIDAQTGFALVASAETCYVWQHAQAVSGIPTCYIFACPVNPDDYMTPPLHSLIPYGVGREPGLLLMNHAGKVRLWDSISIGLAGGGNYTEASLNLGPYETVSHLVRTHPQTFVASTTQGQFFKIIHTAVGGKHHITVQTFSRPAQSSFARFTSLLLATQTEGILIPETGPIASVALGRDSSSGGQDIWALVGSHIQRWDMKPDGWEEALLDADVLELICDALRERFGAAIPDLSRDLGLECNDVQMDSEGKLIVLVSYTPVDVSGSDMAIDTGSHVKRVFSLMKLTYLGDTFRVDDVRVVPYQRNKESGAPVQPRLKLVAGGEVVAIQFGNAIAFCSLVSEYCDRLELYGVTDRVLGMGVPEDSNTVLAMTVGIMIKTTIDLEAIRDYDPYTGRAELIKSTMMQAILYGAMPENPLRFSFPPEVDADSLMQGAMQLSRAVLRSDPDIIRKNDDLTAQLSEQKARLNWLITFINSNGVLLKMSQKCRQILAMDAEKLSAGLQLWQVYDDLVGTRQSYSVIRETVRVTLEALDETVYNDSARAFFGQYLSDLGELIAHVPEVLQHADLTSDVVLLETASMVLTIIAAPVTFRKNNMNLYKLELPMQDPWTSQPAVINVLRQLFDALEAAMEGTNAWSDGKEPLADVAGMLLHTIEERLAWLGSPAALDQPSLQRERSEYQLLLRQERPRMLHSLHRHGLPLDAYHLAERYQDFSTLVALCNKGQVFPPEQNPEADKIRTYAELYNTKFTRELYEYYIQNAELRVIFALDDVHKPFLEDFFSQGPRQNISWLYELTKDNLNVVPPLLLDDAHKATNLEARHLMLSIGKLAQLAVVQEQGKTLPAAKDVLDTFHDELDFVSVHETIVADLQLALSTQRGRQSHDAQAEYILKTQAKRLNGTPAFARIFREYVRTLLQGNVLSVEDMVDVLSMRDNSESPDDYVIALRLLWGSDDTPQSRRQSALGAVWRRIYLHDDWNMIRDTANVSDAELNQRYRDTALYRTLREVRSRADYVSPDEAAAAQPTSAEIAARWPGLANDQVDSLLDDYATEGRVLEEYDLENVCARIVTLAEEDLDGE
ncbi:uncharacterized protein SCHCODRAFT_02632498 [Schizophyllum commune H4-8]|uniref:Nucleoporin Nup133/Nup155-like N-terminal domain-containing protein n=1 Tax=Schizophyllum commune (strain H4-8 / FGSC 9210) TaxID=578458 RepID=D8Q8V8_SCHCM|nr:uncharacterized protein SCHCODRAFT_02632498 [Schizophyllum commune H4-8]KAI5890655.1 hypothetical protein SCHCODRAFT_02632498 [Schizophyllum commune H4-8]